jgi:hypothetical protein
MQEETEKESVKQQVFKYGNIIAANVESDHACPPTESANIDQIGYRWVINPIDDECNFLPNFAFDDKIGHKRRIRNNKEACGCCGVSFFLKKEKAISILQNQTIEIRKKWRYNYICSCHLNESIGLFSKDGEHVNVYEYDGHEFRSISTLEQSVPIE